MNSAILILASAVVLYLAHRFYGRFIGEKVLGLRDDQATPAVTNNDGVDFVPTRKAILFGHHFASIAGLAPIIGPAIAIVWGWLPALLWVILGVIFIGGVHDISTLVVSLRHKAATIGDLTRSVIGPRAQVLFLIVIFFLLALAMGVFALLMAQLFSDVSPEAVIPTFSLILIAMVIGTLVYKAGFNLTAATLIGLTAMAAMLAVGMKVELPAFGYWTYVLLAYAFIASVLPVWLLLQPRDYINSFLLYAGLGALAICFFIAQPHVSMDRALNTSAEANGPWLPFLFITVACGAVSGFHSLVSSGTTSRQLRRQSDAHVIGYGAMLVEGFLAVLVIFACAAGLSDGEFTKLYHSPGAIGGVAGLKGFLTGASNIMASPFRSMVSEEFYPSIAGFWKVFMSVVVVSFAMTTLDSGTRLLRYNIEAIGRLIPPKAVGGFIGNRYVASLIAVAAIGAIALLKLPDTSGKMKPAGLALWQLFGTTNQLLAALGLLIVSVYLWVKKKPVIFTLAPMVGLLVMVVWAMILKIESFWDGYRRFGDSNNLLLLVLSFILLAVAGWICIEGALVFIRKRRPGRV